MRRCWCLLSALFAVVYIRQVATKVVSLIHKGVLDSVLQVFDAQGAVDFVAEQLQQQKEDKATTNRILHEAIRERRCKDNCTIMLIRVRHMPTACQSQGMKKGNSSVAYT